MEHGLLIHFIHVAGTRMIDQGTDGCSGGFLMEGVMAGTDMLYFVDLEKTAIQRHPRCWTGCVIGQEGKTSNL